MVYYFQKPVFLLKLDSPIRKPFLHSPLTALPGPGKVQHPLTNYVHNAQLTDMLNAIYNLFRCDLRKLLHDLGFITEEALIH